MRKNTVNITLSADAELVQKAREYAKAHHTTLNQLVREYMRRLTNSLSFEEAAAEFERVARNHPGRSAEGYRFDRDAVHERRD